MPAGRRKAGAENLITVYATDLAGNATVTNFNVNLVSDTNAPVVTLTWPQDGMQLTGTNFSIVGTMDDPSAAVTAAVVDASGNTNLYSGLVERNGQFWMDNLPLTGGTNQITLTAVDVWGNTNTSNFSVSQSVSNLTIDPVDSSQVYLSAINVSGEVGDSAASVWVNGTQAVNNGNGTWSATNVPVTTGGTASFRVSAYPSADEPSANTNNPGSNPVDPNAYSASEDVIKPPRLYVGEYGQSWSWRFEEAQFSTAYWIDDASTNSSNLDWKDGAGGGEAVYQGGAFTSYDPPLGQSNVTVTSGSCNGEIAWPPTFYPTYNPGTASGDCGAAVYPAPPPVAWQSVNSITTEGYSDFNNCSDCILSSFQWTTIRTGAQAIIMLFTGGRPYIGHQKLWRFVGWATENRLVYDSEFYQPDNTSYLGYSFVQYPVPPLETAISGVGQLGSNGVRFILLENGITKTATTTVAALNDYTFGASATPSSLYITANNIRLHSDKVASNANFCVGQNVSFAVAGAPPDITVANVQWTLDGTFVNESTHPYPTGSVNYTNDPTLLRNAVITNCWWVSGGNPAVRYTASVSCMLIASNGTPPVPFKAQGLFTMYRPQLYNYVSKTPGVTITSNGLLQAASPPAAFAAFIQSGFGGQVGVTQLVNGYATNAAGTNETGGAYYLDNFEFYPISTNVPALVPVIAGSAPSGSPPTDLTGIADGPYIDCDGTSAIHKDFTDYVRFQPGTGGIFVTLGIVNWHVYATAAQDGTNYTLTYTNTAIDPGVTSSSDFPMWTNILLNH